LLSFLRAILLGVEGWKGIEEGKLIPFVLFLYSANQEFNYINSDTDNNNNNNYYYYYYYYCIVVVVVQKEAEKKLKYKSLCIEIKRMWNLKSTIVPATIGATGIVTRSLRKNLEAVPGKYSIDSLQKTAILGHHT